ncbi:MAG: hypothetical protein WED11_07295, partial [Natronospirillum sp.]
VTMKSQHTATVWRRTRRLAVLMSVVVLAACNPGTPAQRDAKIFEPRGAADTFSNKDFQALSPEQQYRVANRLLTTVFRGVPVDEFFDLSNGLTPLQPRQPNFLSDTRHALSTPLAPAQRAAVRKAIGLNTDDTPTGDADALYAFHTSNNDISTRRHVQVPLAQINEFLLSRDLYVEWMAYFLANTIMFSPALEMESTDAKDAAFVYNFLRNRIRDGDSVREIIRAFLGSQSRWRVSRSAENHALEAYELYLGLFDTEEDSRRGGLACRDWRLTSESAQYQLVRSGEPNQEYQKILGNYYVRDCNDLYDVIVSHPLFMPRVTEVIVNYLLAGQTATERLNFVAAVMAAEPQTFEDIFTAILFSEQYLLHTERPLWFEENLFGTLHRLRWSIERNQWPIGQSILRDMQEYTGSDLYQGKMGSAAMEYKIGRTPDVPMDALSFASHSKAMRERVLVNRGGWEGGTWNSNESEYRGLFLEGAPHSEQADERTTRVRPAVEALDAGEYIDYLFLSALMRRATDTERSAIIHIMRSDDDTEGRNQIYFDHAENRLRVRSSRWNYSDVAFVVMDYISRLPETYYLVRPREEIPG